MRASLARWTASLARWTDAARRSGAMVPAVVLGALAVACSSSVEQPTAVPALPADLHGYAAPLALAHARVLTMEDGPRLLADRTVLVEDGRIANIFDSDTRVPPRRFRTIDLGGQILLPGLVDMHVHLSESDVPAYLRHGITTVRDMWGHDAIRVLRERAGRDETVPSIATTSPGIDGSPPVRPTPAVVIDAATVEAVVARLAGEGWEALKTYQNLGHEAFLALHRAADGVGLALVGHVPTAVPLAEALSRMRSIEHLEGYDKALAGRRERGFRAWASVDTTAMRWWAARTAAAGVWNTPTLVVMSKVVGQALDAAGAAEARDNMRLMVRHLFDAGAPLLAGTDAGVPVVDPGSSLHDELQLLVRAGLTPYSALETATANPARFLGQEEEFGSIRIGARADLLIVGQDPLEGLGALRSPTAVLLRGRWLDPRRIERS